MASIRRRRNSFVVVYTYTNEKGEQEQKWESFKTFEEAHKRRAEVEYTQDLGTFQAPSKKTISEFMDDFIRLYGENRWGLSMYSSNTALIRNYVNPIIGSIPIQAFTTMDADKFIKQLQGSKPVDVPVNHGVTKMAPANIEKIAKLLKCAFKQAVRWELIPKNPFESVILPKVDHKKRDIWTADLIRKALDNCDDPVLYVAINLSFACSLRMGEILGLTWDCVHITDADIAAENAWIFVEKELTRVTTQALSVLDQKDVIKVFPTVMCRNHFGQKPTTQLVLKKPKTESSIRRIWLPKTLALILREWHDNQERLKELIGPDYTDYGFVLAQTNGRPWEHKSIEKAFNKLKDNAELPDVVFHSLGHSSTTYKLKLNHGDLKATQGDTGHAQIDMITQIYAHILDEDRKINAQRFEEAFYAKPDLRKVEAPSQKAEETAVDLNALIAQFQQSPELLETLACLVSAKNSENARADSVQ